MARYIDADKLLVRINGRHTVRYFTPTKEDLQLIDIFEIINTQPTADVVEVKHGKWEGLECNLCGHFATYANDYNYCPECGAKMDGGKAE